MISEIQIGNFKAFGPAQTIPLRPITLVVGPNSAGKSSIIHSVLLARHIHNTGNVDAHQTTLGGAAVDLGGFNRYVHKPDSNQELTIQLSFKRSEIVLFSKVHFIDSFEKLTLAYTIGTESFDDERKLSGTATITSAAVYMDDCELVRLRRGGDGRFHLDEVAFGTNSLVAQRGLWINPSERLAALNSRQEKAALLSSTLAGKHLAQFAAPSGVPVEELVNPETGHRNVAGFLKVLDALALKSEEAQKSAVIEELSEANFSIDGFALDIAYPSSGEEDRWLDDRAYADPFSYFRDQMQGSAPEEAKDQKAWTQVLRYEIKCLIDAAHDAIRESLDRTSYLGPLRWIPPRLIPYGEQFDASWQAGGGEAWQRLRCEPELLNRVNRFLQEMLHSQYLLQCEALVPELGAEKIERCVKRALERSVAAFSERPAKATESDLASFIQSELRAHTSGEGLTELSLLDAETGRAVSHRDVGTGISQLLPVLVNAAGGNAQLIAIEQPELHLHPALQADLGDVFIESALGENRNRFLIETHSEHLILRIMRRIRESNAGRQPANLPAVKPEDVAILFVQPTDNGSVVKHLRVDERGRLIDPWPGGFFEESFDEIF